MSAKHVERFQHAEVYLRSRTGKYEWRCVRYNEVYDRLVKTGLSDDDMVIDIGAGYGDFDYFLRHECHFKGRYLPIDAALDGTDLNNWKPKVPASYIVAMEVLEHLRQPERMIRLMRQFSHVACFATVPNPDVVDVLKMDKTHISVVTQKHFLAQGWWTWTRDCFGTPNDSIIAEYIHP